MNSPVFTIGESITISAVGIFVVLAALALLAICIVFISKAIRSTEKNTKNAPVKHTVAEVSEPVTTAKPAKPAKATVPAGMRVLEETTSVGDLRLKNCDDRAAAMIMAIISDELKTPLNQLRFKSIERVS